MLEALAAAKSRQLKGLAITKEHAYALLQACAKQEHQHLQPVRQAHSLIIFAGLDFVEVLCNHLIRLFVSCVSLLESALLFNTVSLPSAHTWSSIISAHVVLGQPQLALQLYFDAALAGFVRNKCIALTALKACTCSARFVIHGMLIHHVVVDDGALSEDLAIQNSLIHLYATCGGDDLADALYLFAALPHKNVTSWNSVLSGYAKTGNMQLAMQWLEGMIKSGVHPNVVSWGALISGHVQVNQGIPALECFQMMEQQGLVPDKVIFLSALKACGCAGTIDHGRLLHDLMVKLNQHFDLELGTALVDMYGKCGSLNESISVFLNLPFREVGPWNALITGYAQCGNLEPAFRVIESMKQDGMKPDVVTLTTMIGACVEHGDALLALELFKKIQGEGLNPNAHTLSIALKACASLGALKDGRGVHDQILRSGVQSIVVANSLVHMYARCGSLEESHKLLTQLHVRNIISWGSLIAGYSECGNLKLALHCIDDMLQDGISPSEAIFASVLSACSHIGLVDEGCRCFWTMSDSHGITRNTQHLMCVVDLLARSGHLTEAERLLSKLPSDSSGWRSLLIAGKMFGNVELGMRCFNANALV